MPPLDPDLDPLAVEADYQRVDTPHPYRFVWDSFWAAGSAARRAMTLHAFNAPIALSAPLLMRALLHNVGVLHTQPDLLNQTIVLAIALALSAVADGVVVQQFYYWALKSWGRIANGLNMRVYRHTLALTRRAQQGTQSGDLVNHMANDAEGIADASFFLPEILTAILHLSGSFLILVYLLGWAAVAAFATLVVMLPITRIAARRFAKHDSELWKYRDDRVTLMSQILAGIRIVKYFAWERSMSAEVDALRAKEIGAYVSLIRAEALSVMIFLSTTTIVAFTGFGSYVLMGGILTPAVIFPCLLVFMQLEMPIGALPHFIKNLSHAKVAAERLHRLYHLETYAPERRNQRSDATAMSVHFHDWSVEADRVLETAVASTTSQSAQAPENEKSPVRLALDSIGLHIQAGESIALVGAVGCGKSALLLSVLGELIPRSGQLNFGNDDKTLPRMAYVAQDAYILNATIRDNILFGLPAEHNEQAVTQAIALSALDHDVAQLSAGLDTEIGERGVNLSGGQKMRIALARAVMHDAGVVLLDDPLAAVDVHTETTLVDALIFGHWSARTRIVATHRLSHLHRFDRVAFMYEGRIEVVAPLQDALAASQRFRMFYDEHSNAEETASAIQLQKHSTAVASGTQHDGSLVDEEDRATGSIKAEVFVSYLKQLGSANGARPWMVYAGLTLSCSLVVVLPIIQNSWLALWSDSSHGALHLFEWLKDPMHTISVYGLIGISVLLANLVERLVWMMRATMAGRDIHNSTLAAVLAAPLRFFDTTPMGRILNRFAHDLSSVDDEMGWNFESAIRSFAQMLGTLVLIVSIVPFVLIAAVPALVVFYRLQRDYRRCAREAKRLSSISRSPRYAHYKESISGLTTIRAFGQQAYFTEAFVSKLSFFQRMNWGSILLNRWFSTRAPLLSGLISLTTTTTVVLMCSHDQLTAGMAGVIITYALTFWANLNWCVRSFSEVESRMTSYERLRAYAALKPEDVTSATPVLDDRRVWPTAGHITFDKYSTRYADNLPLVLRELDFSIASGQRVGIVGRTGSGKTTMFQSLFRFVPGCAGRILVDGIDIATIPTWRLRRAMAVIPQDPMLFIGTVRSNLDRFSDYSDHEVWAALHRVQMDDVVRSIGGLNAAVSEGGQNFSQGQRQLLCLARAILTDARIIVMDEATASVDVQTDALIQRTIREEFKGVTMLIIAHRLNSIADADLIIEMHQGEARMHHYASEIPEEELD